jgi:hypothetical protein
VRIGSGWKWFRIVPRHGFGFRGVEPSGSATVVLVRKEIIYMIILKLG